MSLQTESHGAVEVLHDGRWLRGRLLHTYRQPNGRWRGIVRYTASVGEQYEQGRDQDDIRRSTPAPFKREQVTGSSLGGCLD